MRSLHQRLTLFLALALGAMLLVVGAAAWSSARNWLIAEFDTTLLARVRALTTFPDAGRRGVNLAFTEYVLPEYQPNESAEFFQVWLGDGAIHSRSPSLGTNNLPMPVTRSANPSHWALTLPDGRPGRGVGIAFPSDDGAGSRQYDFIVVFARDTVELQGKLRALLILLASSGIALELATIWIVRRASRAALRPLDSLAREVIEIEAHSLSKRFRAQDAPAEVQPMLDQLNRLLERLEAAFAREQRFAANAAHELLTPVSELRVTAEAAAKWSEDPAATARLATDVRETAEQMERTIRLLLALARSQADHRNEADEEVDLSSLLQEVQVDAERRSLERELDWMWEITPGVSASAAPAACRAIFTNLVGNAVEHAPERSGVRARLATDGEQFVFSIANTNPGLNQDDLRHLFEPFWRKDSARSDRAHAGLGLTLARALAERLGWQLEVTLVNASVHVEVRGPSKPVNNPSHA